MKRFFSNCTICILFVSLSGSSFSAEIQEKFLSEGVVRKVGGYRPVRAEMDADPELVKVAPENLQNPKYGQIEIGDKSWLFILDEPEEETATLYIDTNGDADLTNDPEPKWASRKVGEYTQYSGSGKVELSPGQVGGLGLYRFDPNDKRRAVLKNTLMFYIDFGHEYTFKLDDKEFSTFVTGEPNERSYFPINRDDIPRISRRYEVAKLDEPFNFTGTTYRFELSDGKLTLNESAEELPVKPLPPDLRVGKPAIEFTAKNLAGEEVKFPQDFAGSIVMLDFWATWCGPCIAELPNAKKAYDDWHEHGFEILGISFDSEDQEEKVKEFLTEHELPWQQIYEGKGWETSFAELYDVSGIPFILLVDGDTGKILATERNLRGKGTSEFIGKQVVLKKERSK